MKKWIKVSLKVLASLLIVLFIIFYFSVGTIDKTPYFQTEYYKNTIDNMDKANELRSASQGNLLAGFSSISITPEITSEKEKSSEGKFNKIKLSGFGDGSYATGVHDSIFAKAIALDVDGNMVIMVSADLLLIPETLVLEVQKKLKNKTSLSRNQIIYGATHTHASIGNCVPGYIGKAFGGEFQPQLVEWLSNQFTTVILRAIADKKPAQMGSGYQQIPHLVRNRIIGETGRLNDKFTIVSIQQNAGRQAAIGVFAAHPTTISTWNDEFSGDYPGYFQSALEKKGIDHVMFYAGTVGSHSNRSKGEKFEKPKYIGEILADSAASIISNIKHIKKVELSLLSTKIETPELQLIRITKNLRLSPWLGKKLMPELNSILLQGVKLNDFIWVGMPYELSGEFAIDLKNALELKGFNSAFTSFNGQYLGYIVPSKYYYYDTYETSLMGWYGNSMGDYLMELNYKLANALIESKL